MQIIGGNMNSQENPSGKPLANMTWLENHHIAKLPERTAFAKRLALLHPKRVVDLGCASGLWLELLNNFIPDNCEFIGIDSDYTSLESAKKRSQQWNRKSSFILLDIEKDAQRIPPSDLTLAFNIFPYIEDLSAFINKLSLRKPTGALAVRQYDGAAIRFGPMITADRQRMEADLRLAMENSQKIRHYDLDRTFRALHDSSYTRITCEFELFKRTSPFPSDFIPYYMGTLEWTRDHVSEHSAKLLQAWIDDSSLQLCRYFYEVDLVAVLS